MKVHHSQTVKDSLQETRRASAPPMVTPPTSGVGAGLTATVECSCEGHNDAHKLHFESDLRLE